MPLIVEIPPNPVAGAQGEDGVPGNVPLPGPLKVDPVPVGDEWPDLELDDPPDEGQPRQLDGGPLTVAADHPRAPGLHHALDLEPEDATRKILEEPRVDGGRAPRMMR